jgi:conjugative transfer region lipoprotein (TIGR03751 family)
MQKALPVALVLWISACSTDIKDVIPEDGPSLNEIYNGHLEKTGRGSEAGDVLAAARVRGNQRAAAHTRPYAANYTRDAGNEIDNLFPVLENPTLVMHVFPHLAGEERLPVPGYSTSFSLFERTEFALPGEVATPTKHQIKPRIRVVGGESQLSESARIGAN